MGKQVVFSVYFVCGTHVLLFTDNAMNIWFDGGDGYVFASISEWLQSNNGQLLQSAAFAIGNFARGGTWAHRLLYCNI